MDYRSLLHKAVLVSTCLLIAARPAIGGETSHADKASRAKRNAIIFIADGLRAGSVNATDSPTLLALRENGVFFLNSHAVFPTFTTANASSMATSHLLGDTGDFSNTIYSGYPVFNSGNFGKLPGTVTPFVENDQILSDLDQHYGGNYLNEETLLSIARKAGLATASVGKLGPVAIWDASQISAENLNFPTTIQTVFIDDATGSAAGIPLRSDIAAALAAAGLPTVAPSRSNGCGATAQCNNGFSGNNTTPGTTSANLVQQQYFADSLTKAILPSFVKNGQQFVAVFWSRDPDGTQHNQGDSLNSLTPGINGPTSKASIRNADNNLKQILDYISSNPALAANTDIFVTADHGFATISHYEVDAAGSRTQSYAATFTYKDTTGRVEVNPGFLPPGFLAIDIAHHLNLPLYDPDSVITDGSGHRVYEPVDPTIGQQTATVRQRPASGDGLIGASGAILDSTDAKVIVAANGGSDLIYIPDHNQRTLRSVVQFLSKQDYIGGLFVDDSYGPVPGTLPLSSIGLFGSALTPTPAIAVNFRSFYLQPGNLLSAVQVADTGLQEGQGMHGSLGRDNTLNNMAALGPDFKSHFVDRSPVSNADITRTIAHLLGLHLPSNGHLRGRILKEALRAGGWRVDADSKRAISEESSFGRKTVLLYQQVDRQLYFDEACFTDKPHSANPCR
jgi:hypothetical protein